MINCVYRFLNESGAVIYVGKAKNLKNRLGSHTHLPTECYEERHQVEYITFETEADMDFAERYFIAKYKPKFNVAMVDRDITIQTFELDKRIWRVLDAEESELNQPCTTILMNLYTRKIEESHQAYLQELSKLEVIQELVTELGEDDPAYEVMMKRIKAQRRRVNECRKKREQFKKQRLMSQMGEACYEKTPEWLQKLYQEYGYLSETQLLDLKLKELRQEFLIDCLRQLDARGYYETLQLYQAIDRTFQLHPSKSPDWLKLLATETEQGLKIEKARKDRVVRGLIQGIEQDLIRIHQGLTQDVLMVKKKLSDGSDWEDAIEVEQPVLIHRACIQTKLGW